MRGVLLHSPTFRDEALALGKTQKDSMNRFSALIAVFGIMAFATPVWADTTTVSPSQTSNNNSSASSTPYASNSQVNIQNAYNGVVGTGSGYTCPTTSFSVGLANTGFSNPGFASSSATSVYGTLNVPFNSGGALSTCRDRAKVDLRIAEANLDAGKITKCAEWKQAGLNLNSPKLVAFGCGDLVSIAPAPVASPVAVAAPVATPAPVVAVAYHHLSNFVPPPCRPDLKRDVDLERLRSHRKELQGTHQSREIIALHDRLSHACNVSSAQILHALDGP